MTALALPDLASRTIGGSVLYATDDFFAEKENLIKPGAAVFSPDLRCTRGRCTTVGRRGGGASARAAGRDEFDGHRAARRAGVVRGVVVDTALLHRQLPRTCSVEGCQRAPETAPSSCGGATGSSRAEVGAEGRQRERLRGRRRRRSRICGCTSIPTAAWRGCACTARSCRPAAREGGLTVTISRRRSTAADVLACSDMFFGPAQPDHPGPRGGHERRLGDEAAARGGNDWVIVRLAAPALVRLVESTRPGSWGTRLPG